MIVHSRDVELWDLYLTCDETDAILEAWFSQTLGELQLLLQVWNDETLIKHRASLHFGPVLATEEVLL